MKIKHSLLRRFIIIIMFISFFFMYSWKFIIHQPDAPYLNIEIVDSIYFKYEKINGIGHEKGITRRDPSDIIKVDSLYYIWYTRISSNNCLYPSGYCGTIWYATSFDGYTWAEKGEALGTGATGAFDSHAVFTPNILKFKGKYYLYYTGVKPTPGNPDNRFENNSETDNTAIGIAVSGSPDGPFVRINNEPILKPSEIIGNFDSYRVDDAALVVKNKKIWLYYKGRSLIHGNSGPLFTQMGVAFADKPEGRYVKFKNNPLLTKCHEVLIWNQAKGISTLASIDRSIYYAGDGLDFIPVWKELQEIPKAAGLFRPHLTIHSKQCINGWGISHENKNGDLYLIRFDMSFIVKNYFYGK